MNIDELALRKVLSDEDHEGLYEATSQLLIPLFRVLETAPLSGPVQVCGALGSDGLALVCNGSISHTITWEEFKTLRKALTVIKEIEDKLRAGPHGLKVFEVTQAQLEKELSNPTTN